MVEAPHKQYKYACNEFRNNQDNIKHQWDDNICLYIDNLLKAKINGIY